MRIFVNNVDGYLGQALCADLRSAYEQENRLLGTVSPGADKEGLELAPSLGLKRVVSRKSEKDLLKDILSCSLVVYDLHSSSVEEVERVLKHLKVVDLEHEVTLVLISSVNVWARTKKEFVPANSEEDEEEQDEEEEEGAEEDGGPSKEKKQRPKELTNQDLERRVPAPSHEAWKYLETLALSLASKAKLRPHVVAAGVLYGNGESVFNELFKAAWLMRPVHQIVGPGENYIPCVHVRDVARLVRVVAADAAVDPYLLAVDRSRLTQADIVQGIVSQMTCQTGEVPRVDTGDFQGDFKEIMMLDLVMAPSAPMRAKAFPWWCKEGLVRNLGKVAGEFCKWRNLRPVKVVVMGPPGSGAERYCARVAERYLHGDPLHFSFEDILQEALARPGPAAERLRRKLAKAAKRPGGKLPLDVRTKLVKSKLMCNVCRYRGYVLEGYPTSFLEAWELFTELPPEEGEEPAAEEEEEAEEGEEEDEEEAPAAEAPQEEDEDEDEDEPKPQRRLSADIAPEFAVTVASEEGRCKRRIFEGLARGPRAEAEFLRTMAEYRKENLAEDGSPSTADFFREVAKLQVLPIDADVSTEEEAFQCIRVHLESKGQFFNYLRSEEELLREREAEQARQEALVEEQRLREVADLEAAEERLRKKAAGAEAQRRGVLAENDCSLLESESLPLKRYLMSYVVPTLSEGLSTVCREQPEDPIEFLAQYLFAHAQDIEPTLPSSGRRL